MHDFGLPTTWRRRVADLLDDPVAQAVMRRDGLTREQIFAVLEPVAATLNTPHGRMSAGFVSRRSPAFLEAML